MGLRDGHELTDEGRRPVPPTRFAAHPIGGNPKLVGILDAAKHVKVARDYDAAIRTPLRQTIYEVPRVTQVLHRGR